MATDVALCALHFEVIATRRMDFCELSLLAMLSSTARQQAVAQGPLQIMTDVTRVLTIEDYEHMSRMLRWCGGVVQALRLD